MVTLDVVIPGTYTEKLSVPQGLTPSLPDRGWVVPPMGPSGEFPIWAMFAAVVPAILVYILVFMETHISEYVCVRIFLSSVGNAIESFLLYAM